MSIDPKIDPKIDPVIDPKIDPVIDTICLSGGGIQGISFAGALNYLHNNNVINLNNINHWAGTSAGAFISFILIIGFTPNEFNNFILDFNFAKIEPEINCDTFFKEYGIDNGEKIVLLLSYFLNFKLKVKDITFIELFKITNKKITIIGTNYTRGAEEAFNYINTPDMSVIKAVRISISIPLIYTPVFYNSCFYVDGALINNFPIKYCNQKTTLGIYIKYGKNNKLNSIMDLISCSMAILTDSITEKDLTDDLQIIKINNYLLSSMNYNLTQEDKQAMINIGEKYAKKYINKLTNKICSSIIDNLIATI